MMWKKWAFFEWLHSDRKSVTFETGELGSALGFADTQAKDGPSYSSKQIAETKRSLKKILNTATTMPTSWQNGKALKSGLPDGLFTSSTKMQRRGQ